MMRTLKEGILWLNEFSSLEEAKGKLEKWIKEDYNKNYVHTTLDYRSPEENAKYYSEKLTQKPHENPTSFS